MKASGYLTRLGRSEKSFEELFSTAEEDRRTLTAMEVQNIVAKCLILERQCLNLRTILSPSLPV